MKRRKFLIRFLVLIVTAAFIFTGAVRTSAYYIGSPYKEYRKTVSVILTAYPQSTFSSISYTVTDHHQTSDPVTIEDNSYWTHYSLIVHDYVSTVNLSFNEGSTVTFNVIPEEGYTGSGWISGWRNNTDYQEGTSFTFTLDDDDTTVYIRMIPHEKQSLENAEVRLINADRLSYTGEPVTPEIEVSLNGNTVSPDDYEISYTNTNPKDTIGNVLPGDVTVEITAGPDSEYQGTVAQKPVFTIQKLDPVITLSSLEETEGSQQGVQASVSPYGEDVPVLIEYRTDEVIAEEIPCSHVHEETCPVLSGSPLSECTCTEPHTEHDENCGYKEAQYQWTQDVPTVPGTYDVRASVQESEFLKASAEYTTAEYTVIAVEVPEEPEPVEPDEPEPEPTPEPEPEPEPTPEPVPEPEPEPEPIIPVEPEPEPVVPEEIPTTPEETPVPPEEPDMTEEPVIEELPTAVEEPEQIIVSQQPIEYFMIPDVVEEEPQVEEIIEDPVEEIIDTPVDEAVVTDEGPVESLGQMIADIFAEEPVLAASTAGSVAVFALGTAAFAASSAASAGSAGAAGAAAGPKNPFRRKKHFRKKK